MALAAYAGSGVFFIRPNEIGVVRVLGKIVSTSVDGRTAAQLYAPGPHIRLPWPIGRLDRLRPAETRTATVGFERVDEILGQRGDPSRSDFLTGDQNLMQMRMTVQYVVDDPPAYLFAAASPEEALRTEAENCLYQAIASIGVDDLIGAGRTRASAAVRDLLDRRLGEHHLGLRVIAVNLQAPAPPAEVAEAFNDVQSAKAERNQSALEAESYHNEIVTRAYGEADKAIREAEAYRERRIAEAEGEAKRFEDLAGEYQQAKSVVALRLYIEAMEQILPGMKKVFVDSADGANAIDLTLIQAKP